MVFQFRTNLSSGRLLEREGYTNSFPVVTVWPCPEAPRSKRCSWSVCSLLLPLLGSVPTHDAPSLEPEERGQDHIVASQQNFATNLGFTHDNLTVDSVTGQTVLDRPPITWAGPNGTGISNPRAGACAAYLPSTNQVHYIGGRADPDPSQSGDEASTGMVEIYDVGTNTWTPSAESLKQAQQYIKCAVLGEKIYVVGDHHPVFVAVSTGDRDCPGVRFDGRKLEFRHLDARQPFGGSRRCSSPR